MKKKAVSLMLTAAMLAMVIPMPAYAAPGTAAPTMSATTAILPEVVEAVYVEDLDAMMLAGASQVVTASIRGSTVLKPGWVDEQSYKDMGGNPATDDVSFLTMRGLFIGTGEGNFSPDMDMTRSMIVTVLHRLAGEPQIGDAAQFTDVAADTWYTAAVAWAAEENVVDGMTDTEYMPDIALTREQMLVMLYRYASYSELLAPYVDGDKAAKAAAQNASDWACDAVVWAINAGIVTADATGDLSAPISRAEASAIFRGFVESLSK